MLKQRAASFRHSNPAQLIAAAAWLAATARLRESTVCSSYTGAPAGEVASSAGHSCLVCRRARACLGCIVAVAVFVYA
jgi:hypothetical protein